MFKIDGKTWSVVIYLLPLLLPAALIGAPLITAPVQLDDQPINTSSSVKPNVMFTLDNSGSMDWTYVPDALVGSSSKYCFTNHVANPLYYNPAMTYLPPVLADGSRMANSPYKAAFKDGFNSAAGTMDLSTKYPLPAKYYTDINTGGGKTGGAFYMNYNSGGTPAPGSCYADNKYTVVNMNSATAVQQQNFANWFSYYRTRLLAMKSAAGEAFRAIGDDFRVGFHTINNPQGAGIYGNFLKLDTFSGTHRQNWYNMFYSQQALGGTALPDAMYRIGEYYRVGTSPDGGSVADPVQYSCQPNYHILSTDGYWNANNVAGSVGSSSWNSLLPANAELLSVLGDEFNTTFQSGRAWPRPYSEKPGSNSTATLADIAAYYWQTDLRTDLPNNVPASSRDGATWQHVTQFSVSMAATGTIPYPDGITAIKAGTANWPVPTLNAGPENIDDLWAASVVGHGQFFNVSSPAELLDKLSAALQDIAGRLTSGSPSTATANDYEIAASPYIFRASYVPGEWTGHLEARNINVNAGGASGAALWDARTKLDARVVGTGWDTGRLIATLNTGTKTAVPFRWNLLSAAQQLQLDANTTTSGWLLNYLRGDRAHEDNAPATAIPAPTSTIGVFRERKSVLGSIINAAPTYEAAPRMPYVDSYNPGYSSFKSAKAGRTPMIYVGASDGMLHAFKATVGDADSGEEKWAYVPGLLYRDGVDGLASWAWKNADPLPKKFAHRYRVDQTPMVSDVDFGKAGTPGGGTDWRTMLVAGLNKGGKGYFALDVTHPDAATEADVAAKVLWEFSGEMANDPRMGYSFGVPMTFKTRRFGWVVGVTSGYNNAAGTGHLWLLNPKTGAVLYRFDTGTGSPALPSGLGQFNYFRQSSVDDTAEQLYGADLLGNVWRFDVSSANAADWTTSGVKIAAIGEPITTPPVPSINPYNQAERWVVFGSGKLLSQSDVPSAGSNSTMYAIKDGSGPTPLVPTGGPLTKSALVRISPTTDAPEGPTVKGWYMEMAGAAFGQINIAPEIRRGVVLWAANSPTADVCTNGMSGTVFARRLGSGKNVIAGSSSIAVADGVVGLNVAKVKRSGTSVTSSQAAITTLISTGTGADLGNSGPSFTTELSSGRSNFRYIQVQ